MTIVILFGLENVARAGLICHLNGEQLLLPVDTEQNGQEKKYIEN